MSEKFMVNPPDLDGYAGLLDRNAEALLRIRDYATSTATDTSGFTGLLALLVPAVRAVGELYGKTLEFGNGRMTSLAGSLREAGQTYQRTDQANRENLVQVEGVLGELSISRKGGQ